MRKFDPDVFWVLIAKSSLLFRGPVSVLIILVSLTSEQQGVWYSFLSLSALSLMADMGFTLIVTQFISHEFADLEYRTGFIRGRRGRRDRLFDLIKYSLKVYLVIIVIALLILFVSGFFIFNDQSSQVLVAWILFSIFSALRLLASFFQSIYMGIDRVSDVNKLRTLSVWMESIVLWVALSSGLYLWALCLSAFVAVVVGIQGQYLISKRFWHQFIRYKVENKRTWWSELMNLQGKYAISWFSGFFIFQLVVPVVYKLEGAISAGQFGLTLQVIRSVYNISMAWFEAKIPKMNIHVAKGERKRLMKLFWFCALMGMVVYVLGNTIIIFGVEYGLDYIGMRDRFLATGVLIALAFSECAFYLVSAQAKLLRAHKVEPFYLLSVFHAFLIIICLWLFLPLGGISYYVQSLALVNWFVILPLSLYIALRFIRSHDYVEVKP